MANPPRPKRVAIIGTGLAGLTTAHLLSRSRDFEPILFESGPQPSLDAASLPHPTLPIRLDLPMRSFTPGYYSHFSRLLTHLRLARTPQNLSFTFTDQQGQGVYTHTSAFHRLPPKPPGVGYMQWAGTTLYLLLSYFWFCVCVLLVGAGETEDLDTWLRRTQMPEYFTRQFLLPLISAVATCDVATLLAAPAKDVVEYKRRSWGEGHFVVCGGVGRVQARLLEGLEVRYGHRVEEVCGTVVDGEAFDAVVFCVSPDVVARLVGTGTELGAGCERLRVREVEVVVREGEVEEGTIVLRSHGKGVEAAHGVGGGVAVVTDPAEAGGEGERRRFVRVLRTVEGKGVVDGFFGEGGKGGWRNGDGGWWVVGGWCWDGLVLLEGCVVSAERVAEGLGATVPW